MTFFLSNKLGNVGFLTSSNISSEDFWETSFSSCFSSSSLLSGNPKLKDLGYLKLDLDMTFSFAKLSSSCSLLGTTTAKEDDEGGKAEN